MIRRPARAGYSLMEALVALFVLAVASTGLLVATQAHIDGVRGLEDRVVAQWAAENRLADLALGDVAANQPTVRLMGVTWDVRVQTRPSADPDLAAVRVAVSRSGSDAVAATLDGFIDTVGAGGAA